MENDSWSETVEVFKRMKSPMRPDASETRIVEDWLRERLGAAGLEQAERVEVLVFGVTVETITLPWPENVRLTAVDRSEAMIQAFWPGDIPNRRRLVRGDWEQLPWPPASFHFVFGDGFLNAWSHPRGQLEFAQRINQLLKPGGVFFFRGFAQADPPETLDGVLEAYRSGGIKHYHEFRFRLATALQADPCEGLWVSTALLDQKLVEAGIDLDELHRKTNYEPPSRPNSGAGVVREPPPLLLNYPSVSEWERVLSQRFRILGRGHGLHALGARCPIFALEKRPVA